MKMILTTNNLMMAVATGLFRGVHGKRITDRLNRFSRGQFSGERRFFRAGLGEKNEAAMHGDVIDGAAAKYASGASESNGAERNSPRWSKPSPRLESMMNSYEKEGALRGD
jgi:hypothetical protein